MLLPNEPLPWQMDVTHSYVPLVFEDEMVGLCKPGYASMIVDALNDGDKWRKALYLACYELASISGKAESAELLMEKYLRSAAYPRSGIGAIALMLRNRQDELGVSDREFAHFCDSYRLSPKWLQSILTGNAEPDSTVLKPLARVLGLSVDDVLQVLEGRAEG